MPLAAGTPVVVTWDDAYNVSDGDHEDDAPLPPALERSIGFVVRDDRDAAQHPALVLAMSMHTEGLAAELDRRGTRHSGYRYRDRMRIPAGMIVDIEPLSTSDRCS